MINISSVKRRFKNYISRKLAPFDLSEKPFFTKDIFENKNYIIGEYTYGKPIILDWSEGSRLEIGKFCSIADEVKIFLGGNHRTEWISTYPFPTLPAVFHNAKNISNYSSTKGDVIIGNDVWIGKGASILSGVTIGHGAVIGAYSVVTKNINPYEIHAGNPAKLIRKRFDEDDIISLLKIEWWNWTKENINIQMKDLCNDRIKDFIEKNKVR
ncbi:CatB-related O-acetyltransferase [Larkinella punicea]|uniref:Antibiotic acetyltransferase n=1 Tax=Larkinella punicea TaxID=2315727 RepID=A0A368JIZ4_9BACT|nr:CatB-related O-acetyltransferase [Larkinella punicea]RCR67630.1 antibiotic acetyltransferase [Larkinella punicea]